jgi:hypothetical protein
MDPRPPPAPAANRQREQLEVLAAESGVQLHNAKPILNRPVGSPQYASPEHHDRATKLLAEARRSSDSYKEPSKKLVNRFKSQSKKNRLDRAENWDFSYEERAALFDENVRILRRLLDVE